MLKSEIELARSIISKKLSEYIFNVTKFKHVCEDTMMARGYILKYTGIVIAIIDSLLKIANHTLEYVEQTSWTDVQKTKSAIEYNNILSNIKSTITRTLEDNDIVDYFAGVYESSIEEYVEAKAWINGIDEKQTEPYWKGLYHLHNITYAIVEYHTIPFDLMNGYAELFYSHIQGFETLDKATQQDQFKVLSDKVLSDYQSTYRHLDRESLLHLLLNGYDIDANKITTIQNISDYNCIQRGVSRFNGIANMCLCAKFSYTIDEQILYTNGFTDEEITSFNGMVFLDLYHSQDSLRPDASPVYNELASLYISSYFNCHPDKLSTFLIPYYKPLPNIDSHTITSDTSTIVMDLYKNQKAIWDAKHDLKQYEKYKEVQLRDTRTWLSSSPVYWNLFKRIRSIYNPLADFVTSLYGIVEFIRWQNVDDVIKICPDILGVHVAHVDDEEHDDEMIQNQRINNENKFYMEIAPLLTWTIFDRILRIRGDIFGSSSENIKEIPIYSLIHDIENYILWKTNKMNIDEHLINSVSNDETIMKLLNKQRTPDITQLVTILKERTMQPKTLIDAINMVSNEAFIRDLPTYFTRALYCFIVTTMNITVIFIIHNIIKKLKREGEVPMTALDTKIKALENAEKAMRILIANIKYTQPQPQGGAIKKPNITYGFLLVTNTKTMRTIRKPILKVNNQSNVRHNGELILVSKYKLIMGKHHNRQVTFRIERKKR
jgi:hypothetical protein